MKCQYCGHTIDEKFVFQGFEGCLDCVEELGHVEAEIAYEEALEEMYAGWEAEEEYLRMLREDELLVLEAENDQPPW